MSKSISWEDSLPKNFESQLKASKMQRDTIKALSKKCAPVIYSIRRTKLKEILVACSEQNPCLNEACPKCRRIYRKSLLQAFVNSGLQDGVWTRVSVIPDGLFFPYHKLYTVDLKAIIKRLNKSIQRSKLSDAIIIGGIDISLNVFENSIQGWQIHLYFLINRLLTDDLKKSIKGIFKKGATKSFNFKQIKVDAQGTIHKHIGGAVTYMYKNGFNRRSSYYETRLKVDGSQRLNTRSLPLKMDQVAKLSVWLGEYNIGDRLFLRNIKRLRAAPLSVKFSSVSKLRKYPVSSQKRKTKSQDNNDRPRNDAAASA